jgi:hypothetical protein
MVENNFELHVDRDRVSHRQCHLYAIYNAKCCRGIRLRSQAREVSEAIG